MIRPFPCQQCGSAIADDRDGLVAYGGDGFAQLVHSRCVTLTPPLTRISLENVRCSALHVVRNFLRSRGDTPQALADVLPLIVFVAEATA